MASKTYQPFFRPDELSDGEKSRRLDADDVTNQGRYLLNTFIRERMIRDGIQNAPALDELQEPGTPIGPPMEHMREIARALRYIGDDLDRDQKLQELIKRVPPEAERKTFLNVASKIFDDGIFNWGRVVALFYFGYKVCVQAWSRGLPLIRAIINLIVDFLRDHVAQWIIDRGGWEAIVEYFGTSWKQLAFVLGAGLTASVAVLMWKSWH